MWGRMAVRSFVDQALPLPLEPIILFHTKTVLSWLKPKWKASYVSSRELLMLEEVGREAHPRCLEEGHHTSICFRGASALHFPTLLPCVHCGGVSEQTAFTDISVATPPDSVCSADAAVPVRDSAPAACVWVAAQDASISAAVSVRTVGDPLAPARVPPSRQAANFAASSSAYPSEALASAGNGSLTCRAGLQVLCS